MSLDIRLFLTGEGKSDIGYRNYDDGTFVPREMTHVARAVMDAAFLPHKINVEYEFLDENGLTRLMKGSRSSKRQPIMTNRLGSASSQDSKFPRLWMRAKVWGEHVMKNKGTIAVMFTDADTTRSQEKDKWRCKYDAIAGGFSEAGMKNGVPMVPQPKSEAWLLAYYQKEMGNGHCAYQNCSRFECLRGTDDPSDEKSAKVILSRLLKDEIPSEKELRSIEWDKVDMPSFNAFRDRMRDVVKDWLKSV